MNERLAVAGLAMNKLEPFRSSDLAKGIYVDDADQLGRVWYHIPNLGPKFCDAVRKYSVVANFREAHVIARKKSKESECMWVGIVGDPGEYTTGSKRHVIEFMLRNPGAATEQAQNRRAQTRSRATKLANPLKKRRRKKRRGSVLSIRVDSSTSSKSPNEQECVALPIGSDRNSLAADNQRIASEDDESSSQMSTTPSLLSVERQPSGNYAFGVSENTASPQPSPSSIAVSSDASKLKFYSLPRPTSTSYRATRQDDWLGNLISDKNTFALRDPQLSSPEGMKPFSSKLAYPPSPEIRVVRKYSVEDLNVLLSNSEFADI
jgi:hypothetical protein